MREDKRTIRCAVYTRKSTEEGLEQEFKSLDAQREACVAYIASQRHEGWVLAPGHYDDGGFSGGNMQRPGLVRLMADIEAGKVDTIVVYKVDRLTRNLADFAKIVDVLDAKEASFVSITQSFNTTTSMGRLTLNVLLSFAQFEREVTGERIRDKIAASKKKGLWMGGPVPLGYIVQERRLVVQEEEAELVRHIMRRYLALHSVKELVGELDAEERVTKIQKMTSGPHRGGVRFGRGTLFHLLRNRIYLGEIIHKGTSYPGEHDAIVPVDLWNDVQAKLDGRDRCRNALRQPKENSLLASKLHDADGRNMVPSHASKGGKRYRYYVTRHDLVDANRPAWRVGAHGIETIVADRIAQMMLDQSHLHALVLDS
ncbi:MAG: recombinase family protein, partial [Sphingomonas sp.]|nr:recombinase family protein [Sphingomonas sp.]